jgi:predicted small metal-binding protein
MAKELRCRDIGMNCDFVIRAESEGEVMRKAAEHARKTHGMKELAPDMNAKVRAAIRNVQEQGMPEMSPAFGSKGGREGTPQTPPGFPRKGPGEGTPQTPPRKWPPQGS